MDLSPEPSAGRTPLLRRISADFPHRSDPADIVGYISLPGGSPGSYALVAYGDFMAPTIQDNDLVLFSLGGEAKNGDIVLVNSKWGDIILRRYRIKDDGEWFSPDNSVYTPFQPVPHSAGCAIIIMTAKVQEQDRIDAFASGADDYIGKPFDLEDLKKRVETFLGGESRQVSR